MRRVLFVVLLLVAPLWAEAASFVYPGPIKAEVLADALNAAFPALAPGDLRVESKPDGAWVRITVPDAIDKAAVDAVVAAHNPAVLSLGERTTQKAALARGVVKGEAFAAAVSPADVDALVDTLYPGMTGPQRAFLKRLAKTVLGLVRERGLDE